MKLILEENQLNMAPEPFLRRAGYGYFRDRRSGKESFSRRLGSGIFPKLHMYVSEQGEKIVFDLHLDQKQPSYGGSRMHNAEHDGEVVEGEIARLKELVTHNVEHVTQNVERGTHNESEDDTLDKIGGDREYIGKTGKQKKKKWWKFW